jgi:Tfp pilus assembly protein PilV
MRDGMTVIEVVIALSILAGSLLGMATFITRFTRAVTTSNVVSTAGQLAAARLEIVKGATQYRTIDSLYAKTESPVAGFPGFTRQTLVQRVGGQPSDVYDYRIITVKVNGPGLTAPVSKTTIIANF